MNKTKITLSVLLVILSVSLLAVTVTAAPVGNGKLYAQSDPGYSVPLPLDSSAGGTGMSLTMGQTVYLEIKGITEFSVGQSIYVKVKWGTTPSHEATLGPVTVLAAGDGTRYVRTSWVVGEFDDGHQDIPYCTTMPVEYGTFGAGGVSYQAKNAFGTGNPPQGHLHVIPEYILGTAGALLSFAAAIGVFTLAKRRKLRI